MVAADTLADRTVGAAQWRLASTLVGAVARFGIGVLIARLLAPADFGVVALALVVLGFAQPFGDLGIASAVVQRRDLTSRHVRVAFTFSVATGVAIAAGLVPFAPVAETSPLGFAAPDLRLSPPACCDAISISDASSTSTLPATCYGVVPVTLALTGRGVWRTAHCR